MCSSPLDSAGAIEATDPLPQRYLTADVPGIGGAVKLRPEDFLVDEVPLYEPCGEGEHLYLRIEKTGVSHAELIGRLRRHYGVREREIGFAGMKDKFAVTRQTVSVHLPTGEPPPEPDLGHDRIRVLWTDRHTNKIRIGHLAGNRFSIRIREVDPMRVTVVKPLLERLERDGFPNYFGWQRFGYRSNNHLLGAALLKEDWEGLLGELLGTNGSPFPEYQRERRELFDRGCYEDAARRWTRADRNELTVINSMVGGKTGPRAVRSVGRNAMLFWISALQSAVFNRVLDHRLDAGTLFELHEGDLAWKHDSGSVFRVTARELRREVLPSRLAELEVSPSGPMWGAGMTRPEGAARAVEEEALGAYDLTIDTIAAIPGRHKGARRSLRAPIHHPATDAGADEHGPYIRVAFDLSSGSYATVVLGEIMKGESRKSKVENRKSKIEMKRE